MAGNITRLRYDVLTDTGGDFSGNSFAVEGAVVQVRYVADTGAPLDTGADLDITGAITGVVVMKDANSLGASFTKVPSQAVYDTGGTALANQRDYVYISNEEITVTVEQSAGVAGTKEGTVHLWVMG